VSIIELPGTHADLDLTSPQRLRTIQVTSAIGRASTTLAAFDRALLGCGVGNFNLLRLSSVIPPDTDVVIGDRPADVLGDWGDRLYVVMAEQRVDRPGRQAWAGIGWVQHEPTGRGLFVEHEGFSEDQVRSDLEHSLSSLMEARPNVQFGPMQSLVRGEECDGEPICAMVVAVYEAAGWTVDLRGN
jgi:arginine decarboxylase